MAESLQLTFTPEDLVDERLREVVEEKRGPWPLPYEGRKLLQSLSMWHRGAEHAKPLAQLVRELGISEREVKALVRSLIVDFAVPIGSSRGDPGGYYLIIRAEEISSAIRPLVHEVRAIVQRIEALGGSSLVEEFFGQLRLGWLKKKERC